MFAIRHEFRLICSMKIPYIARFLNRIGITLLMMACGEKGFVQENNGVFIYNEPAGIRSLDPADAFSLAAIRAQAALFETLFDEFGNPVLANHIEIDSSGTLYRIELKDSVDFHPTQLWKHRPTMHAGDVVATLQFVKTQPRQSWLLSSVVRIDSTAPNRVEIKLKESSSDFIAKLSSPALAIRNAYWLTLPASVRRKQPVGTGPYLFHHWEEGDKIIFHADTAHRYFRGKKMNAPKALCVVSLKDGQTMLLMFLLGKLDMLTGLNPAYTETFLRSNGTLREKWAEQFYLFSGPFLNVEYLGINLRHRSNHPLQREARLRSALSLLLRRDEIISAVNAGIGRDASESFIPPELYSIAEKDSIWNPRKIALQWFQEVGYDSFSDLPEFTIYTDPPMADFIISVAGQWQQEGLKVNVVLEDRATLKGGIARGEYSLFRASWIADYPSAENYFQLFFSEHIIPNGSNYTQFSNPSFDQAYRGADYATMYKILNREMPVIPLFYDNAVLFVNRKWSGVEAYPSGLIPFHKITHLPTERP
jgi:ABC-type transport system substrate-binding protein